MSKPTSPETLTTPAHIDLVRAIQARLHVALTQAELLASTAENSVAPRPRRTDVPSRGVWSARGVTRPRTELAPRAGTAAARVKELEETLAAARRALADKVERAASLRTALASLADDVARLVPGVQAQLDAQARATAELVDKFQALQIELHAVRAPPTDSVEEEELVEATVAVPAVSVDLLTEIREQLATQASRLDAQRCEVDALLRDVIDRQRETITEQRGEIQRLCDAHALVHERLAGEQEVAAMRLESIIELSGLEDKSFEDQELIDVALPAITWLLTICEAHADVVAENKPAYPADSNIVFDTDVMYKYRDKTWRDISTRLKRVYYSSPQRGGDGSDDNDFQLV